MQRTAFISIPKIANINLKQQLRSLAMADAGNWWDSSRSSSFSWPPDSLSAADADPNLHINMALGLPSNSQAMDWNQHALGLMRGEKSDGSFRSMVEEKGIRFEQEEWGRDSVSVSVSGDHELKQINRSGFSLDSPHLGYGTPSTILQGLLGSQTQQQTSHNSLEIMNNYHDEYPNYGMNNNDLLRRPKEAPFWNATMPQVRPAPFLPTTSCTPPFDDLKPAKINMSSETLTVPKKSGDTTSKRPRSHSPSPLPAFKVRKEKMGDRITALQQLVSPFGKTDTASVLSEAIEYIKFLHEQVNVLSTPYLKSGASIQHQQSGDKSSKDPEGAKHDLRSKGLCLVPVSSTFPVAHETTVDFWTPTFGGTFR